MARAKNTKIHNIFLIDKNKLLRADETQTLTIESAISTIMSGDSKYKVG